MSILSKSEIQFLQGQKQVSKSYEYKLKSIIKKKISRLMDKEIPLISTLFPNLTNLTKFSKDNHKGGVEAPKAAQSGQALRPFESQIPGSNPGRSIDSISFTNNLLKNNKKNVKTN
ncbi:MAG: hypothetical protein ABJB76_06105, partial [Candidatus Nitrosocosmicus sp.]